MAGVPLELPVLQNWSCHNCGGCCRQHVIEITDDEQQRIMRQGWSAADSPLADQAVIVSTNGRNRKASHRLAHQPDGSCVFLDDGGLCRIHAKFGEAAKPLACRVYPYAFHPAGNHVAVSLRFSCPSVVNNLGTPVAQQERSIKKIAQLVVPDQASNVKPPPIRPGQQLDWPDVHRILGVLDQTLQTRESSLCLRLLRCLNWLKLVERASFEKIRGARLHEFLEIVSAAAAAQVDRVPKSVNRPGRITSMLFRLLVAQYLRRDTAAHLGGGYKQRLKLLKAAMRFAAGSGVVPSMDARNFTASFDTIELSFGPLPAGADELLTRYLRVKIQGIHFCGRAYYDIPLVEGFQSLALTYPAILWIARLLATSASRDRLRIEDIADAISVLDHNHGYSQAFGQFSFRLRVRILAALGHIEQLCVFYGGQPDHTA